jgi:hypothetical protein
MLRLLGARFKRGRSVTAADPVVWADQEMSRLQADLAAVAEELALAEAELAEARALLRVFARAHDRLLAPLHAELDEIEARIAEACAAASGHPDDIRDAQKARASARESAASAGNVSGQAGPAARPEPPPAEAKVLYRALARRSHPDLGSGDADRERRRTFMIRVNDAYARGDVDLLRLLAAEWDGDAAAAAGADGSGPDRLSRLRSMVAAARGRLARVRAELADVTGSGLGPLLFTERPPGLEAALGRLDVLAGQLRSRIGERRRVLADLTGARP